MLKRMLREYLPARLFIRLQAFDHYYRGEPELRLLPNLCDRNRCSLDIGANVGIYTYFMRRLSRSVCAFEPNPELAFRLHSIFPEVVVRANAASDMSGELRLRVPVISGRRFHELASVSHDFKECSDIEEYVVDAVRIDDEDFSDIGFIKIDAEHHEIEVLNGALSTITRCRPKIMTEVTPLLYSPPLPDVLRFVTDLEYSAWFSYDGQYLPFTRFDPHLHANPSQWKKTFMGSNVILLPNEDDGAFLSRARPRRPTWHR